MTQDISGRFNLTQEIAGNKAPPNAVDICQGALIRGARDTMTAGPKPKPKQGIRPAPIDYKLFCDGAEIDDSTASAMLIDASLWRGLDIRELMQNYTLALDFSDDESLDSMTARESIYSDVNIEIVPVNSDSLICNANPCRIHDIDSDSENPVNGVDGDIWRNAPVPVSDPVPVPDIERFAAMSFQSVANLILRESAAELDRLKAWEYLNASADDIAKVYWTGLSTMARGRILGAMALDLSDFGFIPSKVESAA